MKAKFLILVSLLSFSVVLNAQQSDFNLPVTGWKQMHSKDLSGDQRLLTVKEALKNKIYLYWMSPDAETGIQDHPEHEEVIVLRGSLYWLNNDKSVLKKLDVGAYVDRKPHIKHGPFKAGPEGCLMYVRLHS